MKDTQCNGQRKNEKGQTIICKTLHKKLTIVKQEPH
jgi:hypothetical protein